MRRRAPPSSPSPRASGSASSRTCHASLAGGSRSYMAGRVWCPVRTCAAARRAALRLPKPCPAPSSATFGSQENARSPEFPQRPTITLPAQQTPAHHPAPTTPPQQHPCPPSAGGRRIPQGGQGTELPRGPRTRHRRARRRRRQPAGLAPSHRPARRWWYPPPLTPYPPPDPIPTAIPYSNSNPQALTPHPWPQPPTPGPRCPAAAVADPQLPILTVIPNRKPQPEPQP